MSEVERRMHALYRRLAAENHCLLLMLWVGHSLAEADALLASAGPFASAMQGPGPEAEGR